MYVIQDKISQAGERSAYRLLNPMSKSRYWGKVLNRGSFDSRQERLYRLLSAVDCPLLPAPVSWGKGLISGIEEEPAVIYPWIDGQTLDRVWPHLGPDDKDRCIRQLLRALQLLHFRGHVHGDVKAENILVDADRTLRLIDVDWAYPTHAAPNRRSGSISTMSPEILEGSPPDGRSDLYSSALVLGALMGQEDTPPFSLQERLRRDLKFEGLPSTHPWRSWLEKCCHRDPVHRWESAVEAYRFAPFQAREDFFRKDYVISYLRPLGQPGKSALQSLLAITGLVPTPGGFIETIWSRMEEPKLVALWDRISRHRSLAAALNRGERLTEALIEPVFRAVVRQRQAPATRLPPADPIGPIEEAYQRGDYARAIAGAAARLSSGGGSVRENALLLHYLGLSHLAMEDRPKASEAFQESYARYLSLNDSEGLCKTLSNLALLDYQEDDLPAAQEKYLSALSEARKGDNQPRIASILMNLSAIAQKRLDLSTALSYLSESLHAFKQIPDPDAASQAVFNLSLLLQYCGRIDKALHELEQIRTGMALSTESAHRLLLRQLELLMAARRYDLAKPMAETVAASPAAASANLQHLRDRLLYHARILNLIPPDPERSPLALQQELRKSPATPDRIELYYLTALFHYRKGDGHAALEWLDRIDPASLRDGKLLGLEIALLRLQNRRRVGTTTEMQADMAEVESRLSKWAETVPKEHQRALGSHPLYREALRLLEESPSEPSGRNRPPDPHWAVSAVRTLAQLSRAPDLRSLMDWSLAALVDVARADRGFIVLLEEEPFRVEAAINFKKEAVEYPDFEISRGLIKKVADTGMPIVTTNAQREPGAGQSVYDLNLLSVLVLPLMDGGKIIGAAYLDHRYRQGAFDAVEQDLLLALSQQIASAISQKRLLGQVQEQAQALETANRSLREANRQLGRRLRREGRRSRELSRTLQIAEQRLSEKDSKRRIVYQSLAMQKVHDQVRQVRDADIPVLITGESGTGKELLARTLHQSSKRAYKPFVAIHCGAIPDGLVEAELFGYVRGAFTGAERDRPGAFVEADTGTLFLDEIGTMSLANQVKLLRVLQDSEIQPLGSSRTVSVDVRIISASNADMESAIARGTFREDLYYRINGIRIHLPPLRQRVEDIPGLIRQFTEQWEEPMDPGAEFSHERLKRWMGYPWPGNVRELFNRLQHFFLTGVDPLLDPGLSDNPAVFGEADALRAYAAFNGTPGGFQTAMMRFEFELLQQALRLAEGNGARAARLLGINKTDFYYRLRKHHPQ